MKKYVAYIVTDAGMILQGIVAENFDTADQAAEREAKNFAGGQLWWLEEYNTNVQAEFDAIKNLFGSD